VRGYIEAEISSEQLEKRLSVRSETTGLTRSTLFLVLGSSFEMTLPDAQPTFERVGIVRKVGDIERHACGS
jgi:hypothetical protein